MVSIFSSKHVGWEGKEVGQVLCSLNIFILFADSLADLPTDLYYFSSDKGRYKITQGSIAYVISSSELYMLDSTGTWVQQQ